MTEVWMSDFLLYFCVSSQEGHADTENVAAAIDTYNGISVSSIWRARTCAFTGCLCHSWTV